MSDVPEGYKQTDVGVIPEEWDVKELEKVGRVIDGDRGSSYPSDNDFSNDGYCLFLSAKNVTIEGFKFLECSFITKEKDNLLSKGKLIKNDIVLTTRGTVGNIAFFNDTIPFDDIRINSGMVILRNENNRLDTNYLYEEAVPQINHRTLWYIKTMTVNQHKSENHDTPRVNTNKILKNCYLRCKISYQTLNIT